MRKFLLLSILAILPAFGCECIREPLRRVEVWKQQTLFGPPPNVVAAPPGGACGAPAVPECGCGIAAETGCGIAAETSCGQASGIPAVTSYGPETIIDESANTAMPGPMLTEEPDSIPKQP